MFSAGSGHVSAERAENVERTPLWVWGHDNWWSITFTEWVRLYMHTMVARHTPQFKPLFTDCGNAKIGSQLRIRLPVDYKVSP